MSEDRSLDEFAVADQSGTDRSDGDSSASDEASDSDSPTSTETVADPVIATATWTTDGADCDRCGASVQRRWHDDDVFVCAACKTW